MASKARKHSWSVYDEKRRECSERRLKEHCRYLTRKFKLEKSGVCENCKVEGKATVFHHPNYKKPLKVVELCHKCHRAEHKRPTPNGGVC